LRWLFQYEQHAELCVCVQFAQSLKGEIEIRIDLWKMKTGTDQSNFTIFFSTKKT